MSKKTLSKDNDQKELSNPSNQLSFLADESNTDQQQESAPRRQSLWKSVRSVFRRKKREEKTPEKETVAVSNTDLARADAASFDHTYEFANYESSETDYLEGSRRISQTPIYDNARVINDRTTGFYDNLNSDGELARGFESDGSRLYELAGSLSIREPEYDLAANVLPPQTPIYDFASNNEKIAKWLAGNLEDPRSMRFQTILSSINRSQRKRFKEIIGTLLATNLNLGIDVNVDFDLIDSALHNFLIYEAVAKHEEKIRPRLASIDRLETNQAIELLTEAAVCYFVLEDLASLKKVNTKLTELIENQQSLSSRESLRRPSQADSSRSRISRPQPAPAIQELKEVVEEAKAKTDNIREIVSILFEIYSKGQQGVDPNLLAKANNWLNENGATKPLVFIIMDIDLISELFSKNMFYDTEGNVIFSREVDEQILLNTVMTAISISSISLLEQELASIRQERREPNRTPDNTTVGTEKNYKNPAIADAQEEYNIYTAPKKYTGPLTQAKSIAKKADSKGARTVKSLEGYELDENNIILKYYIYSNTAAKVSVDERIVADGHLIKVVTLPDGSRRAIVDKEVLKDAQQKLYKEDLTKVVAHDSIARAIALDALIKEYPDKAKPIRDTYLSQPSPARETVYSPYNPSASSASASATSAAAASRTPSTYQKPPSGPESLLGGWAFPEPNEDRQVRPAIYVPERKAAASSNGVNITEVVKTLFEIYKKGEDKIDSIKINRTKAWLTENGINKPLDRLIESIQRTSELFTRNVRYDSYGIVRVGETEQRLINCIIFAAENTPNASVNTQGSKNKKAGQELNRRNGAFKF